MYIEDHLPPLLEMAAPIDNTSVGNALGHSYGSTTVEGNAKVQLGDSIQQINIHGNIHIHSDLPLDALCIANLFSELQHEKLCSALLNHSRRTDYTYEIKDNARDLYHISQRLRWFADKISAKLIAMTARGRMGHVEDRFHQYTSDEARCMRQVALDVEQLSTTTASIDSKDVQIVSYTGSSINVKKRDRGGKLPTHMETDLTALWQNHILRQRLETLSTSYTRLMPHLAALLSTIYAGHNLDGIRCAPECNSLPSQADGAVVGAVTMNRTSDLGSDPYAAILRKADGDTMTIAHDTLVKRNEFLSGKLIGYNFRTRADNPESRQHVPISQTMLFMERVKELLSFPEEDDRRSEIKVAHQATFLWVFKDYRQVPGMKCTRLRTWLSEGQSCFWINGKAGSGKSTLMKYIYQQPLFRSSLSTWANGRQLIVLSFFFWSAGQPLQKSYEGLLRSLLRQLLTEIPELLPALFPRLCEKYSHIDLDRLPVPTEAELRSALLTFCEHLPSNLAIVIMIDGIDEYSGMHYDFCRFLVQAVNMGGSSIKALVSSRPIPACHQVFSSFPSLRLQDLTSDDISAYIKQELTSTELFNEMDVLEEGFAAEVQKSLVDKASGVFLWIILVVRTLLIGLGEYDSRARLIEKIDELPNDLEKLYDHMFGNMSTQHQQEGALLLKLACRAKDIQQSDDALCPFTALQLYHAVQASAKPQSCISPIPSTLAKDKLKIKAADGMLRSRCCGLLEVQYTRSKGHPLLEPKVDFLHRTVYDYLQDPAARDKIDALCGLKLDEVDLILMTSMFHVLYRGLVEWRLVRKQVWACFAYGRELSRAGVRKHIEILQKVDELTQENATTRSRLRQTKVVDEYLQNTLPPWIGGDVNINFEDVQRISLCFHTIGSSPDFFRVKSTDFDASGDTWVDFLFTMYTITLNILLLGSPALESCFVKNLRVLFETHQGLYDLLTNCEAWRMQSHFRVFVEHVILGQRATAEANGRRTSHVQNHDNMEP